MEHVTLADGSQSLLGHNGSSVVMHRGADDYRTDPPGTRAIA